MTVKLEDPRIDAIDYPTSDGRPMAETDLHRWLMFLDADIAVGGQLVVAKGKLTRLATAGGPA